MYVQFSDSTQGTIIAWFGSPQDPDVYSNQGEVESDDPRYAAFLAATNPQPSVVDINTQRRNDLLDAANRVIPALQDAVDLGDSSANPDLLKAWKQFRVAVNRIVLTQSNPVWPAPPQDGYGSVTTPPSESS